MVKNNKDIEQSQQMGVFGILERITSRHNLGEFQKRALRDNIVEDFVDFFYARVKWGLKIIFKFNYNWDSRYFHALVYPGIRHYSKRVIILPHYKPIWDSLYKEANNALMGNGINIKIAGVDDVCRWGSMNADYFSAFGLDNRVSINSGTAFFAHVFCRSVQPFLMDDSLELHHPVLAWILNNHFRNSSIAFCTNNHRKSLRSFFLIPYDDSLLDGVELFVLCHELGHAFIQQNGRVSCPFNNPQNLDLQNIMAVNEEFKADFFAVNTLRLLYKRKKGDYLLFGPCFLFYLLGLFEEAGLISTATLHPDSKARYSFILELIKEYDINEYRRCVERTRITDLIWRNSEEKIKRQVQKYKQERGKYASALCMVREYANHYFRDLEDSDSVS